MANISLPYLVRAFDTFSNNIETVHHKLGQAKVYLSIMMDWVSDCDACTLGLNDRQKFMEVFSLLEKLVGDTKDLLPEATACIHNHR